MYGYISHMFKKSQQMSSKEQMIHIPHEHDDNVHSISLKAACL
jgi:hypothetical protein